MLCSKIIRHYENRRMRVRETWNSKGHSEGVKLPYAGYGPDVSPIKLEGLHRNEIRDIFVLPIKARSLMGLRQIEGRH